MVKCVKKSESVTHTGSQKVVENLSLSSNSQCSYFHYLCGPICPTAPSSPHKALENGLARRLPCRIVHRQARKMLKIYSESSFLDGSNDTNYRSLGLFWVEQLSFQDAETILKEHSGTRNRRKLLGSFFPLKTTIARPRIGLESWNWCH